MINETGVFFFPGGGHDHDGENSSLIDTNLYSVFDFQFTTDLGGPDRRRTLDRNFHNFTNFVIDVVNRSIIQPAGIRFQPGSINGSSDIITNSITTNLIQAGAITANLIQAGTITANLIAANTITANNIVAGTITATEIAAGAITTAKIAAGAITANEIATDAITASEISAGAITTEKIAAGAITTAKIAADAITANEIAADTITANEIAAGAITANEIAAGAITANMITTGTLSADRISGGTITGVTFNATVGNIGGFTLSSGTLIGDSASTVINPNGNILIAGSLNASGEINSGSDINVVNSIDAGTFIRTQTQFIGKGTATVAAGASTNLRRQNSDGEFRIEASKRELKKDITAIENSVDLIQGLNPISFRFKDESDYDSYSDEIKQKYLLRKEYGFIAEDVAQAVPDLGIYTPDKNSGELVPQMWQQNGVIALCVGAIKDLVAQIGTLEARIATLERELGYTS